jgi:hypothetical protein
MGITTATLAAAALSNATYQALLNKPLPPLGPVMQVTFELLGMTAVTAVAGMACAKVLLGERFHIELHR